MDEVPANDEALGVLNKGELYSGADFTWPTCPEALAEIAAQLVDPAGYPEYDVQEG